jgi:tetratricopeptide (TPR) repeat protein
VNGAREASVVRGWPVVIRATILHPAVFATSQPDGPIVITGKQGPWTAAVRVIVRDMKGNETTWPLEAAGSAPAQATLRKDEPLTADWVLSPDRSAGLPEGSFEIAAVLHAPGGVASSLAVPAEVTVQHAPAALDDEQQADLHLITANYHFTRGDPTAAGAELDRLLAKNPSHVTALALKAELLASQNRFDEALESCGKAIDAHLEHSDGDEPPHALLALQRDLLEAAEKPD